MADQLIDLRSDTVTHPTPEMRQAMAEAELGDDVFGDDPTVIALEERAAELTGMQAALFVASGTMGNLVSLMSHVPRGGEIIAGDGSHSFAHEAANYAVVVGASMRLLPWDEDGRMDLDQIRRSFRNPDDVHDPITSLITLENTHSDSMAQPLPADYVNDVAKVARAGRVPLHVDGARIFNAAVALQTPVRKLLHAADSATFCLSKGLACPVGSVVVGTTDFIWKARRARKLLGGGMRQVGVLAAAGLIALRDGTDGMIDRLAEDHDNARRLAAGLADLPGVVRLDPARVRTNFVFFELSRADVRMRFLDALRREGVLMIDYPGGDRIRAVTHYGISQADVDEAVAATRRALHEVGLAPKTEAAADSAAPVGSGVA
jgi:threonine aldolase